MPQSTYTGNKLGFGKHPALFVCDLQYAYTNPKAAIGFDATNVIGSINRIISHARKHKVKIFFSVLSYNDESLNNQSVWIEKVPQLKDLKEGTNLVALDERLDFEAQSDVIIQKPGASVFFGTDFDKQLKQKNIDTLIVTGCTTSGCVRASVVDAIQYNYRPMVVREAVSDRSQAEHENALAQMEGRYADVISIEECISQLEKSE